MIRNAIKDRKNKRYLSNAVLNDKAQIAYETYAVQVQKKSAPGNVMPTWEDLSPNQKNAWRSAVHAILTGKNVKLKTE